MANNTVPCSCIRDTFRLSVFQIDGEKMLLHDLSNWIEDQQGFVYPDFFMLTIKDPSDTPTEIQFSGKYGQVVEGSFVDGVYTFSANICGVEYTQREFITVNVECCLANAYIELGEQHKDKLLEIFNNIQTAKASAKMGAFEDANKLLMLTNRKLELLKCDCNCKE